MQITGEEVVVKDLPNEVKYIVLDNLIIIPVDPPQAVAD